MNKVLAAGALLGFLSVAIGASIEHVLRGNVQEEVLRWTMTAIRYHQVGALVITAIGLALLTRPDSAAAASLTRSGWLFVAGTLLFSFSIYAAALTGVEALTYLTPVGGVTLMLAWLSLLWPALAMGRRRAS
ncbi:MAG TPA: DUF423 domain-containing protein [Wenzhouxiangellaceae bacterium]|nr:DUF423 domain-containing protein [Wenzhouxiangellaceae bacterium]